MKWAQIQHKWKQVQRRVHEQWSELTDDDLDAIGGRRDRLLGKLQEKYGLAREELERQVEDFERACHL